MSKPKLIEQIENAGGLWDKVNKIFYSNAGTGTFTGGPAVTLTGWHKIKGVWAKLLRIHGVRHYKI